MQILMLVVALMAGCSARSFDRSTLITSTAMLAWDWSQTRGMAERGWAGMEEDNPILGPTPDTRGVDAYFASTIAINFVLWMVLPPRWRSVIPVAVTAVQARTVMDNAPRTGMFGH